MTDVTGFYGDAYADRGRLVRRSYPQTMFGGLAVTASVLAGAYMLEARLAPSTEADDLPAAAPVTVAVISRDHTVFDPASLGVPPLSLARSTPLGTTFAAAGDAAARAPSAVVAVSAPPPSLVEAAPPKPYVEMAPPPPAEAAAAVAAVADPPLPPARPPAEPVTIAAVDPAPAVAPVAPLPSAPPLPPVAPLAAQDSVEDVPFPAPRPPEFRAPAAPVQVPAPTRTPGRQVARLSNTPTGPAAAPDNRSFFQKLFGLPQQPAGPALAYAAPEDGGFGKSRGALSVPMSSPAATPDRLTAVYDISAHTVYMPDGTRLEAHSGLGDRLDDPRHVSERMRGATPPHVYDLEPRAQLFHGVQALRLNPVGGGGVFGRSGLLAHTYMLGPNGDSNGCVSFRNYQAFLQAFRNGSVKRLVVVARQS